MSMHLGQPRALASSVLVTVGVAFLVGLWLAGEPAREPEAQATSTETAATGFPALPAVPSPHLRLIGTVVAGRASSATFSTGDQDNLAVALGGEVLAGTRLEEVRARHVVVARGGLRERVDLEDLPARPIQLASRPAEPTQKAAFPNVIGVIVDGSSASQFPAVFKLQPGDNIVRVNGEDVSSPQQLAQLLGASVEGTAIHFEIRRTATNEDVSYWANR